MGFHPTSTDFFFNIASFHLKILFGLNTANRRARFCPSGLRFITSAWPKRTAREGADQGLILSQDQRVGTAARARCQQLQGAVEKVPVIWSLPPSPGEAPQPACPPARPSWPWGGRGPTWDTAVAVFSRQILIFLFCPPRPCRPRKQVTLCSTRSPRNHDLISMLSTCWPHPPTPHAPSHMSPLPSL